MIFQNVILTADVPEVGDPTIVDGFCAWQEISVRRESNVRATPVRVTVRIHALPPGFMVFYSVEPKPGNLPVVVPIDETGEFTLPVNVDWQQNGGQPRTRMQGNDNAEIIIVDPSTSHLTQIEIGLVTRQGRFFLTAHQIWKGWASRNGGDIDFIPSEAVHAYPGARYETIWHGMEEALEPIVEALPHGNAAHQLAPPWDPEFPDPNEDWQSGVVQFFNLVSGTGRVRSESGTNYFVHFRSIKMPGPMKILEPMSPVYFKVNEADTENLKSVSICVPA